MESIESILPICDEFVVNVGDSQDETLSLIQSIRSPKIKIIQNIWNMAQGKEVLSEQTNLALKECQGDWAFYLQSDEVIHQDDLPRLRKMMHDKLDEPIDALRLKWLHFYGSYHRYRVDHGWYQKQDRILRNNGEVESFGDAFGFRRKDQAELRREATGCLLYHYGWVHSGEVMAQRRKNAQDIGFVQLTESERSDEYDFGDLGRFPIYFGSHPQGMVEKVEQHELSQNDWKDISKQQWWNPMKILKLRVKTPFRPRK